MRRALASADTARRRVWAAGALVVAVVFVLRLPAIVNADALDSDGAVVGLQARHLSLHSARGLLLWGTQYQGITSVVAAGAFRALLPERTQLATILSAVTGYALGLLALFGCLRRVAGTGRGALCTLLVAAGPWPLLYLSFTAARTWAFTLVFVTLWLGERALDETALRWRLSVALAGLAGLSAGLAYYTDLFDVQFLPGLFVYAVLAIASLSSNRARASLSAAVVTGFVVGSVPRWVADMHGVPALGLENVRPAVSVLVHQCAPYAFGVRLHPDVDAAGLDGTVPYVALAAASMVCFVALFAAGSLIAVRTRGLTRAGRLCACGVVWAAASIAGFLLAGRSYDLMSARYLVTVLLAVPLVAAGALELPFFRGGRGVAVVGVVLLHFVVAGWLGYGDFVRGPLPVRTDAGTGRFEREIGALLLPRGVTTARAQYWVAYRMTATLEERVLVVPWEGDRFGGYRKAVDAQPRSAWIFSDRNVDPVFTADAQRQAWRAEQRPFEEARLGPYTVLIPGR